MKNNTYKQYHWLRYIGLKETAKYFNTCGQLAIFQIEAWEYDQPAHYNIEEDLSFMEME